MKNSKYWEEAALHREIAVREGATATLKDVLNLYDKALDDINEEIRKIQFNFQKRFGIDDDTAAYFLSRAQQEENLQSLVKALEAAPNEKARRDILEYIHRDGLSVRAYSARIERYEAVKDTIYARIKGIAAEQITLVEGMLKNAYKEAYYGVMDDVAKGVNVGINFALLDDRAISEAIGVKWHGKRFSERIWNNTDTLASEAQNLVTKSLMSGESLTKTSRKLADSFGVGKYHATTLVQTETAHVHAMADLAAYEDLDIEEYKYLAALDSMTCDICQQLDGMVFKVSEAVEGDNYPVMHPRCRCTTTVNMDYLNRKARDPVTGKNRIIDGDTTYKSWVKNMSTEQKQALKLSQKKDSNRVADKLQFERYKKVLGTKEVGRSFDKFQEMKYSDPEKWTGLKALYRQNLVDNFGKSDIIKVTEMFRKMTVEEKERQKLTFISKNRFEQLTIEARKNGAKIIKGGAEVTEHLNRLGAAASTIGDTLLFRDDVCISEVLEETYHFKQNINKVNDGKLYREILNEIEAKEYLLSVKDKYKIPRIETEITKQQLSAYKKLIQDLRRG